jgi:DNA-binding transcriptional regulator YiaG
METLVLDTSVTRTLVLALRSVGGRERLAARLGVSEARLRDWLEGRVEPPIEIYLRALDLVAKGPFAT